MTKTWFTTTANVDTLQSKLRELEEDEHVIFSVTPVSGKIIIISYTEA